MELGYIDYAQQELDKIQSVSGSIPAEIEALSKQVGEKRLSLRVGASFLFANLVIGILLTGLVLIQGNASPSYTAIAVGLLVPVFIDSMIGVNLWKGHARQWQTWAVYRAAIGLVLFGLAYLAQGDFLDFFLQAAFCGSLLVILTGRSGRMRTWIAIGIYVIGYIGLLLFTFVISFLAALVSG